MEKPCHYMGCQLKQRESYFLRRLEETEKARDRYLDAWMRADMTIKDLESIILDFDGDRPFV